MFIRKAIGLSSAQNILKGCFSVKNSKLVEKNLRTRNFFEVDPLFPDAKDDESKLYRDFERIKAGSNKVQERALFEKHTSHMFRRIKQSLEREEKIKKLKGQRYKKLSEELQTITENVFLDEETKLPYGIGLDDYIELIKEESITTKTGQFYSTLEVICRKIGAYNDVELVKLYQFILAEKVADSFKNEARQFLLKRLIGEIQKLGWNSSEAKTKLRSYLDSSKASNEFVESALKEGNNDKFAQTVIPLLNNDSLTNQAQNLALANIQDKIRFNTNLKKIKQPPKRIDQEDPFFSEESDIESNYAEPLFNYDNKKPMTLDYVNPYETYGRKVLEEKQIWDKVKKNYYDNKRKYYKEKMYTEENKSQEVINKETGLNLIDFLINSKDEQEIRNLIHKYNLIEEVVPRPDFKEVLNNIDFLVDQASTSIKVQIAKEKNQNKNLYFRGNFLQENLKPEDLMWKHFESNFLSIFPENIAEEEQVDQMVQNENDIRFDQKELDIQDYGTGNSKDQEKRRHSERDLSIDSQMEIELYRRTKTDPFFRHYIQHEIQYFTERIQDGVLDIAQGFAPAERKLDTPYYYDPTIEDIPNDLIGDEELRLKYQKLKQESSEGIRVFDSGKRKTSTCLVVIKEGTGKVFVNNEIFYRYFTHPFNRNIAIKPLFLSSQYCEYDIHYHVRGGGVMAQSHACQIALARGLLQLHPNLRPIFMKLDLLRTDYRQKERKKTGRYKARKAHTYVRR